MKRRKKLILKLLAVGLSTVAIVIGTHFFGEWVAADRDIEGGFRETLTFAAPAIAGATWLLTLTALAFRED